MGERDEERRRVTESSLTELPTAEAAERSLVGAVLICGVSKLKQAREVVLPEHIASEAYRLIYAACLALADRGEGIDLVTAQSELEKTGQLERAGGAALLSSLVDRVPDVENVKSYGHQVRDAWQRRKVIFDLRRRIASIERGEPDELIDAPAGPVFETVTAEDLLRRQFPRRKNLLSPWLAEKSLAMLYSHRGLGKTWIALSSSLAVASGGPMFRGWKAERPACVLHVDGEMPAEILRDRVAQLVAGGAGDAEGRLRFLAADLQPAGLSTLSSAPGQRIVEEAIGEARLLVFDNISTLFPGLDENDSGAWDPVQAWLLSLRRRGLSVLMAHHAGKGGQQRGTSKREDALDVVINLRLPEGHEAADGCRFEVVFEKARGLTGRAVQKFEAELLVRAGRATWNIHEISDEVTAKIIELQKAGTSLRAIAGQVGIDVANVSRRLARAKRQAERALEERGAA
jgi:hypothetical protein